MTSLAGAKEKEEESHSCLVISPPAVGMGINKFRVKYNVLHTSSYDSTRSTTCSKGEMCYPCVD